MGRLGTTDDVANLVSFIASKEGGFITGAFRFELTITNEKDQSRLTCTCYTGGCRPKCEL
jgi:hypothetical protein